MSNSIDVRKLVEESSDLQELLCAGKMTLEEAERWVLWREKTRTCQKCTLHQTCAATVFGVGSPKAPFLFVGEAPTIHETHKGEPLCGRAGQFMRQAMQEAGFQQGDVFITTVVCCSTPDNRMPTRVERDACFIRLWNILEVIRPKIIVAMGAVALKELCPKNTRSLGGVRGSWVPSYGYRVMPVWHPSYVLATESPLRRRELEKDLRQAYLEVFAV